MLWLMLGLVLSWVQTSRRLRHVEVVWTRPHRGCFAALVRVLHGLDMLYAWAYPMIPLSAPLRIWWRNSHDDVGVVSSGTIALVGLCGAWMLNEWAGAATWGSEIVALLIDQGGVQNRWATLIGWRDLHSLWLVKFGRVAVRASAEHALTSCWSTYTISPIFLELSSHRQFRTRLFNILNFVAVVVLLHCWSMSEIWWALLRIEIRSQRIWGHISYLIENLRRYTSALLLLLIAWNWMFVFHLLHHRQIDCSLVLAALKAASASNSQSLHRIEGHFSSAFCSCTFWLLETFACNCIGSFQALLWEVFLKQLR